MYIPRLLIETIKNMAKLPFTKGVSGTKYSVTIVIGKIAKTDDGMSWYFIADGKPD